MPKKYTMEGGGFPITHSFKGQGDQRRRKREKAESFDYFFLFESLVNWKERTTSGHLSSVFLKFMLGEMGFSEEMVSLTYFEAVSTAN